MARTEEPAPGQLAFIRIRVDQEVPFGLAAYQLEAQKSGMPSPIRLARFDSMPDEIRNFVGILVRPAPENGMLLPKRDQLLEEAEEIAVLAQQSPVLSN